MHGTHNGYVAVPPENKYHGKHYMDIGDEISVHGGLTFSEPMTYGEKSFRSCLTINEKYRGTRNIIADHAEYLTEHTEIGDDWFVFGFDTFHVEDTPFDCDRNYVAKETLSLLEQLEKGNEE